MVEGIILSIKASDDSIRKEVKKFIREKGFESAELNGGDLIRMRVPEKEKDPVIKGLEFLGCQVNIPVIFGY